MVLKAQKSMYQLKVAIFDENMAVGKSENLVTLHLHDLTQPFLRGSSDFGGSVKKKKCHILSRLHD